VIAILGSHWAEDFHRHYGFKYTHGRILEILPDLSPCHFRPQLFDHLFIMEQVNLFVIHEDLRLYHPFRHQHHSFPTPYCKCRHTDDLVFHC